MADAIGNADEVETIPMQCIRRTAWTEENCGIEVNVVPKESPTDQETAMDSSDEGSCGNVKKVNVVPKDSPTDQETAMDASDEGSNRSRNSEMVGTQGQSRTSMNNQSDEKIDIIKVQKGLNVNFDCTRNQNPKAKVDNLHVMWLCNRPKCQYEWKYTPDKTNAENKKKPNKKDQKFEFHHEHLHSGKLELTITFKEGNAPELTETKIFLLQVIDKTGDGQGAENNSDQGTGSTRSASNQGPSEAGGSNQGTYQAGSATNQGIGSTRRGSNQGPSEAGDSNQGTYQAGSATNQGIGSTRRGSNQGPSEAGDSNQGTYQAGSATNQGIGSTRRGSNQGPSEAGGSDQGTYQAGSATNQGIGSTRRDSNQGPSEAGDSNQGTYQAGSATNQGIGSTGSTSNQGSTQAGSSTTQGTSGATNQGNSSQSKKTTEYIEYNAQVEILIVNKGVDVTFECISHPEGTVDEEHVRFHYEVAKGKDFDTEWKYTSDGTKEKIIATNEILEIPSTKIHSGDIKLNVTSKKKKRQLITKTWSLIDNRTLWDVCMDENNWEGIDYENEDCNDCMTKFTRIVIFVLLFLTICALMIMSKGSFLKLVSLLSDENRENAENDAPWIVVVMYLAMIVILPDLFILLKYAFLSYTKKDKRAPRERQFYVKPETNGENGQDNQIRKSCAFIWAEFFNCLGIMLWIFVVCPRLTSMENLFFPSTFIMLSSSSLQEKTSVCKRRILLKWGIFIFLIILQILIFIFLFILQKREVSTIIWAAVSTLCLHVKLLHTYFNNDFGGDNYSKLRAATAFLRIIASILFLIGFILYWHLESDTPTSFTLIGEHFLQQLSPPVNTSQNVLNNLIDLNTSPPDVLGLFVIHLIAANMLFYFAVMACRMRMQIICFAIPLAAVPVVCAIIPVVIPMISQFYEVEPIEDWKSSEHVVYALFFPFWLLQVGLQYHIFSKQKDIMPAKSSLFFLPSYCTPLAEIYLLHSRKLPDERNEEISQGDNHMTEHTSTINNQEPELDMIYICATMWHETLQEMKSLIFSILRLDFDQALTRNSSNERNDMFDFEVHVIFDDAFEFVKVGNGLEKKPNKYVQRLETALKEALRKFYNREVELEEPGAIETEYGQKLEKTLPGGKSLFIHLKDKEKIKIKKRWSQVMYMYYLLGFKLIQSKSDQIEENKINKQKIKLKDTKHVRQIDNTYILALDCDVTFYPTAIKRLLARMKKNKLVAASSGRIVPDGSGPVVWYQKFEYAIGHWLQKSTEHVFGCVLCSPGCFTLFRAKALLSENIMRTYTNIATEPRTIIQYDQGEDRWLCTLLLKEGFRVEYYAGAQANTSVPTALDELLTQRKRWFPSTIANICDILDNNSEIRKINQNISWLYIAYQIILLLASLLSPSTLLLAMGSALQVVFGFSLWYVYLLVYCPPVVYVIICLKMESNLQRQIGILLSLAYALLMSSVLIGLIANSIKESWYTPSALFLYMLIGIIFLAGLLHGRSELWNLLFLPIYFIFMPLGVLFIPIYAVCNINDVSWGTRDHQKPETINSANSNIRPDIAPKNQDKQCQTDRNDSKKETLFWQSLIAQYLDPNRTSDVGVEKQKQELEHFRNKMATIFFFVNLLWIVSISSTNQVKDVLNIPFSIAGGKTIFIEPLGFVFLIFFALVLVLQVIGLLIHRYSTLLNVIAATNSPNIITCIKKCICCEYCSCCKRQKNNPKTGNMEKDDLANKFKSQYCKHNQEHPTTLDLNKILKELQKDDTLSFPIPVLNK